MVNYSGTRRRAYLAWNANAGNTAHIGTAQVTKLLGIPLGYHALIYKITGLETAGPGGNQNFFIYIDPNFQQNEIDLLGNWTFQTLTGGGSDGEVAISDGQFGGGWKILWLTIDANNSYRAEDVGGPFHCWNSFTLSKAEGATWGIQIEYELVPGAMHWLDEWADALDDKYNVAINANSQAAGSRFYQVGDYYQIGKRTYD